MTLPTIQLDILKCFVETYRKENDEGMKIQELYKEMYTTQPMLKAVVVSALNCDWSDEKKDGYCKGVLQTWHLLNQQSIVEELNGE